MANPVIRGTLEGISNWLSQLPVRVAAFTPEDAFISAPRRAEKRPKGLPWATARL
jgi:hypothetical protein